MNLNHDEFLWMEKYRPRTVSDTILPKRLKDVFQQYVDRKEIPNLLLTGPAGVGKTTVALAMCEEIGLNYMMINSSEERGIDTLRTKIVGFASTVSLTGGHKVIILDEADGLTPDAQTALRGTIEKFSGNCTFILTCNFKARLIDAIHSRCTTVDFTLHREEKPKMALAFYKRVVDILETEGVEYEKEAIVGLVQKFFPDYRRILNELQRYAGGGVVGDSVLTQISDIRGIEDLVRHLKDKNFAEMRKWVVLNSDIDPAQIYRKIYDSLYNYLKPESIPQAVVTLAEYQYKSAFVADQEINLVACLTEMMVDCEFK